MPSHKTKRNERISILSVAAVTAYEALLNAHMDRLEQLAAEVQLNELDELAGFTTALTDLESVIQSVRVELQAISDRLAALEETRERSTEH